MISHQRVDGFQEEARDLHGPTALVVHVAGLDPVLRVKAQAGSSYQTYLRFDLSSLTGPATSVKLRLHCLDTSTAGGSIFPIASNTWSETGITWNNRPLATAPAFATLGGVTAGFWTEIELGPSSVSAGLVSFVVAGGNTNSAYYSSREGAFPPELVVTRADPRRRRWRTSPAPRSRVPRRSR